MSMPCGIMCLQQSARICVCAEGSGEPIILCSRSTNALKAWNEQHLKPRGRAGQLLRPRRVPG